ncbi:hypothetical protein [Sporosarcina limicola]|uniref:Uncharacterized protein n=1 Tax=Sporosarcina limicola TaxID=34101 RepID=A0A927MIV6_9BACL|nr:hypothetical protein [Sporosarcina limicola]MBE1553957.1 hypothetical protein [Sporosarcina limicola]
MRLKKNEPSITETFELLEGLKIKSSDFIRPVELEVQKSKNNHK